MGGVAGFYVHDDKSYKMNFLHGDGHVEFKSAPSTLGAYSDSFYTGNDVQSANLIDTGWNTQDKKIIDQLGIVKAKRDQIGK